MANKLIFSEENINLLFGQLAAEDEDFSKFQAYYIKTRHMTKLQQIFHYGYWLDIKV